MAIKNDYDAIVVGSGITGGWAAKELTEKGLKVLLLERGPNLRHGVDYKTEHKPPWEFAYRDQGDRKQYRDEYQIQSQCYAFGEATKNFFVNDKQNPYTHDPDKPYSWIRGYQLGGRSLMWARQSYRLSNLDFEANALDGVAIDWPIRYEEIAPWYDYVEEFIGVSGQAEGLPQLPDGIFQPPMEMNCVELVLKERIEKKYSDRMMTIGRAAVLTQPKAGRAACHYCGPCERGCSTGSYFSSLSATLPVALATKNLTIRPDSIVHSVIYNESKDRASGVRVIDANTHDVQEFSAKIVFLCASTLGTTQILLNSSTPRYSNGLANSSGVLGHYLMDHTYESGASGTFPGFEDKYYSGRRPNGIYIPRFQNITHKNSNYLRGYGFQGSAQRPGWRRGVNIPGFGAEFKHALREPGPWRMGLDGFGECLPRKENHVKLDSQKVDAWGIPLLKINATWSENERQIEKDASITAAEMLENCGAKDVVPYINDTPPGLCIHEMGTARMGNNPKTSVLNKYNQCHDVSNLFVTDGSFMTSSACQNPSLTYMAFTARACNYAVGEMKKGNL